MYFESFFRVKVSLRVLSKKSIFKIDTKNFQKNSETLTMTSFY